MSLPTGKLDPVPLDGVGFITDYETAALPTVATSVASPNIPQYNWGMLGNDQVGNCTLAGAAHLDMAWNVEVDEHNTIPTTAEDEKEYFSMTGGVDSGLAMTTVTTKWVKKGLFGYKVKAAAPVALTQIALKQSIQFYGGAYLGVQLPDSAQSQFHQGGPTTWSVVAHSPIDGGHCIIGVGFNPTGMLCVSWGQLLLAEWSWIAKYMDEAYVIVPDQFVEANKGPSVLNLAALEADYKKL